MVTKQCKICGEEFKVYPKRKDTALFCSSKCFGKSRLELPTWNKGLKTGIVTPAAFKKGHKPWHDGTIGLKAAPKSAFKKGHVPWISGKKMPAAWNKGLINPMFRGKNNPNWKGGITSGNVSERYFIMNSLKYKEWRKKVFERDDWTCQQCVIRGGVIQANHILPFSIFKKLRLELANGQTLCASCHKIKTSRFLSEYGKGFYRGRSLQEWGAMSDFYQNNLIK